jgi:hypothetical protein
MSNKTSKRKQPLDPLAVHGLALDKYKKSHSAIHPMEIDTIDDVMKTAFDAIAYTFRSGSDNDAKRNLRELKENINLFLKAFTKVP